MRRILLLPVMLLSLALGVAGCSMFQKAYDVVTSAKVSPTVIIVAANVFDGLKASATNYLMLKRCPTATGVCRSPVATKIIIPAINEGTKARNTLEQFLVDHPGELGPQGAYDALIKANSTLQSIFTQYNIR